MSVSLLEMSLMGGAMIALVHLIQLLFKSRLPHWVTAIMWGTVLVRLILPFSIPSPVSLLGLIKGTPQTVMVTEWHSTVQASIFKAEYFLLMGTTVCALLFLAAILRQKRVLDMALPVKMTPEMNSMLAIQKLSQSVRIYTSDRLSTPVAYGVFRPRIVLPAGRIIDDEAMKYVITHECVHIKRRDVLKKLLLMLVVCLHWFNPLVWLMAATMRRDIELTCDQRVLMLCGIQARASYANILLSLETSKRFSGLLVNHFSRSPLETRIRSIMTVKKPAFSTILMAVLAYGLCSVALAASPMAQDFIISRAVWTPALGPAFFSQPVQNVVYVWQGDVLTLAQPASMAFSTTSATAQGDMTISVASPMNAAVLGESASNVSVDQSAMYSIYTIPVLPIIQTSSAEIQP